VFSGKEAEVRGQRAWHGLDGLSNEDDEPYFNKSDNDNEDKEDEDDFDQDIDSDSDHLDENID
jgi:hypothetical protein